MVTAVLETMAEGTAVDGSVDGLPGATAGQQVVGIISEALVVVGVVDGLSRLTVGIAVSTADVELADGLWGVTVGGLLVVGGTDGLSGVTLGPDVALHGLSVGGVTDGFPGVTVGPKVPGSPLEGLAVVAGLDGLREFTVGPGVESLTEGVAVLGIADGLPGVTVGHKVKGTPVVGLPVVGVAEGLPGVNVGPALVGVQVIGLVITLDVCCIEALSPLPSSVDSCVPSSVLLSLPSCVPPSLDSKVSASEGALVGLLVWKLLTVSKALSPEVSELLCTSLISKASTFLFGGSVLVALLKLMALLDVTEGAIDNTLSINSFWHCSEAGSEAHRLVSSKVISCVSSMRR